MHKQKCLLNTNHAGVVGLCLGWQPVLNLVHLNAGLKHILQKWPTKKSLKGGMYGYSAHPKTGLLLKKSWHSLKTVVKILPDVPSLQKPLHWFHWYRG